MKGINKILIEVERLVQEASNQPNEELRYLEYAEAENKLGEIRTDRKVFFHDLVQLGVLIKNFEKRIDWLGHAINKVSYPGYTGFQHNFSNVKITQEELLALLNKTRIEQLRAITDMIKELEKIID